MCPWNEKARTKQKQQTNGNRAIWLVYQTDTNVHGFWLVKRTLWGKNSMPENFVEIIRYFALTSYYNAIGQSHNAFPLLGVLWRENEKREIFSPTGWQSKQRTLSETIFQGLKTKTEENSRAQSGEYAFWFWEGKQENEWGAEIKTCYYITYLYCKMPSAQG